MRLFTLFLCSNAENPICIGHPCQRSTSREAVTFSGRMRSWLRHRLLRVIFRMLHVWQIRNYYIWSRLSVLCFENLKSIFLCPCLDFNGDVGIYCTELDGYVQPNPVFRTHFSRKHHAGCMGLAKSAPKFRRRTNASCSSPIFQIIFSRRQLLIIKCCYNYLKQDSRKTSKK